MYSRLSSLNLWPARSLKEATLTNISLPDSKYKQPYGCTGLRVICAHSCAHLITDAWFVAVRSGSIKPAVSSYSIFNKHLSFHSAADKDSPRPELLPVSLIFRRRLTFRGRNFFTSCFYRKGRDSDLSERQCHVLFTTEDVVSCNLSRPESTQEYIRGGAALEIRNNLSINLTGLSTKF